jgi:hypothetical protein
VACGKNLAHRAAAIVSDQINLFDFQRVEKRGDHARLRRVGNVLAKRWSGVARAHQVDRNTAAYVRQSLDYVTPLVSV